MKKSFNVNGTKFTVDVQVEAEDTYSTLPNDYKKIMYLLGKASSIGAKLDQEFTVRPILNAKRKDILEMYKNENFSQSFIEDDLRQNNCLEEKEELVFSNYQKENILQTIDSTMWWYKALRNQIKSL